MRHNGIRFGSDGLTGAQTVEVIGIGNGQLCVLVRGCGGRNQLPPIFPSKVPARTVEVTDGIATDRIAGDSAAVEGLAFIGDGLVIIWRPFY